MTGRTDPEGPSRIGLKSSVGPRELNQDSAYIREYPGPGRYLCLGAVADGMGGHKAGGKASSTAIELLFKGFDAALSERENDPAVKGDDLLFDIFSSINAEIHGLALRDEGLEGMGTTLTAFLAEEGRAFVAHVGDSRAYLVRGGSITQITDDHTLVERLVRENVLTRDQAAEHPDRHVITRAVGIEESLDIDLLSFSTHPQDIIMLCTDGLHDVVGPSELLAALAKSADLQEACEEMVRTAIRNGTTDNVTVLLWEVPGPRDSQAGAVAVGNDREERPRSPEPRHGRSPLEPEAERQGLGKAALALIFALSACAGFLIGWLVAALI